MTLPRKPIPKIELHEMTAEELNADMDSLQNILDSLENQGEAPLNYCFDKLQFHSEQTQVYIVHFQSGENVEIVGAFDSKDGAFDYINKCVHHKSQQYYHVSMLPLIEQ